MHVSHPVTNYEFFYEPFYVSMDSAPPFDERFIGYGFTRNTQVVQLHNLTLLQRQENTVNYSPIQCCLGIRNVGTRVQLSSAFAYICHPLGLPKEENETSVAREAKQSKSAPLQVVQRRNLGSIRKNSTNEKTNEKEKLK